MQRILENPIVDYLNNNSRLSNKMRRNNNHLPDLSTSAIKSAISLFVGFNPNDRITCLREKNQPFDID